MKVIGIVVAAGSSSRFSNSKGFNELPKKSKLLQELQYPATNALESSAKLSPCLPNTVLDTSVARFIDLSKLTGTVQSVYVMTSHDLVEEVSELFRQRALADSAYELVKCR